MKFDHQKIYYNIISSTINVINLLFRTVKLRISIYFRLKLNYIFQINMMHIIIVDVQDTSRADTLEFYIIKTVNFLCSK